MIYAIIGELFALFINQQVTERNTLLAQKRDMLVNVDPAIARAFESTNHISTSKGKGAHLL